MVYLLDSGVFIQASRLHYGLDFCPAFWEWLEEKNRAKKVFSISKVLDELKEGNDGLANWAKLQGDEFYKRIDNKTILKLTEVTEWVKNQGYDQGAINDFLREGADYYLVSYALAHSYTVVTHETRAGDNATRRIKIPNVCEGIEVECINTYKMLRNESAKFVLG